MPNCCATNYLVYKHTKKLNMNNRTFAEKIFKSSAGSIVFKKPDIILTHDNTASIFNTFKKWEVKKY